jgi:hypothetical protein
MWACGLSFCNQSTLKGHSMQTLSMDTPSSFFTLKQALFICSQNNVTDDEWTYKVENVGNSKGLVVIRVYDENNQPLGYF